MKKLKATELRKLVAGAVLADGEVTGHAHRVGGGVAVFEGVMPWTREFETEEEATVTHEEHKPIVLPAGKEWASGQVLETDHLSGLVSPVRD